MKQQLLLKWHGLKPVRIEATFYIGKGFNKKGKVEIDLCWERKWLLITEQTASRPPNCASKLITDNNYSFRQTWLWNHLTFFPKSRQEFTYYRRRRLPRIADFLHFPKELRHQAQLGNQAFWWLVNNSTLTSPDWLKCDWMGTGKGTFLLLAQEKNKWEVIY